MLSRATSEAPSREDQEEEEDMEFIFVEDEFPDAVSETGKSMVSMKSGKSTYTVVTSDMGETEGEEESLVSNKIWNSQFTAHNMYSINVHEICNHSKYDLLDNQSGESLAIEDRFTPK